MSTRRMIWSLLLLRIIAQVSIISSWKQTQGGHKVRRGRFNWATHVDALPLGPLEIICDRCHDEQGPNDSKETLVAHNLHWGNIHIGHEEIFKRKLGSLHSLRDNDQSHPHHHLFLRDHLGRAAFSRQQARGADKGDAQNAAEQAEEVVAVQASLEEGDGEKGGKEHLGPSHHLIDGGSHVQEPDIHEHGCNQVKDGWDREHEALFELVTFRGHLTSVCQFEYQFMMERGLELMERGLVLTGPPSSGSSTSLPSPLCFRESM